VLFLNPTCTITVYLAGPARELIELPMAGLKGGTMRKGREREWRE